MAFFLNERSLGFYWPHARVTTLKKLYTNAINERNKLCTKSYQTKNHKEYERSYEIHKQPVPSHITNTKFILVTAY